MSLANTIKSQLRSVIEWDASGAQDNLFWRWTVNGDEIKNCSKLIINPGQGCVFVYEGAVKAVWTQPGKYELKTDNFPFWTTVTKFMQAFVSDHKVGVYFFKTAQIADQKWGTTKPLKYVDATYKFPVELKAFGNYSVQITEPAAFFTNFASGTGALSYTAMRDLFLSRIEQPMKDYMAEAKLSYAEIDSQLNELSQGIIERVNTDFAKLGFKLVDFRISGTSFDDKTMERISRIADATADAAVARELGISYERQQQLEALKMAAKNEGGGAGMGMGLGAGIAAGQAMGGMFASVAAASQSASDPNARLKQLKAMLDGGLINQAEFEAKKKEILSGV